jgi:hypothetical protein
MPGEFTRGKEKVSTYPGKEKPREGEGLNMPGDTARGMVVS